MNSKLLLPLAGTALVAFALGFVVSPAVRHESAAGKSTAGAGSSGSRGSFGAGSDRAPLAGMGAAPTSVKEIVAQFKDALADSSAGRRMGRLWWLSQQINAANAKEIVEQTLKDNSGIGQEYFATAALFDTWGRVDPKAALAYAENLKKGAQRDQAIINSLRGWATQDFDAAKAWADAMPSGQLKRSAANSIIAALAESDPDRALDIALKQERTSDGFAYAYSVFPAMVRQDPEHAAERALNLPPGSFRTAAMRLVAQQWSQRDRDAAMKWMESLPDGAAKQQT
ncbi:MAG: hypothetical protein ACREKL_14730, partial [Chthoniobacterales bacterium]